MPLYRWNADNLDPVSPTTFEAESIQEAGLQRLLRDQPEVLEEGLFIIAEEFSSWPNSTHRIDLLCLDEEGNLVVVELKRTRSGDHSELQAVRYAAMVSNITFEHMIEVHQDYLEKHGVEENARVRVLSHLGLSVESEDEEEDEFDEEVHTERPRIILASAGFSAELTTSVLWLRDGGMDITCVKLQLYSPGDGLLLETIQIIPSPEATDCIDMKKFSSLPPIARLAMRKHGLK